MPFKVGVLPPTLAAERHISRLTSSATRPIESSVFDMAFFSGPFAARVREFSHDYNDANVRLEVVTLTGSASTP